MAISEMCVCVYDQIKDQYCLLQYDIVNHSTENQRKEKENVLKSKTNTLKERAIEI